MEALDVTNNYDDHYKNRIILNWNAFGSSEVRVVLYKGGSIVKELKFDARGTDKLNWFSVGKLTNMPWADIKAEAHNFFSVEGDAGNQRRLLINRGYGGCPNDNGWMVITSDRCDWENRFNHKRHMILYSKLAGHANWNNYDDVGVADALAVYVR